MASNVSTRPTSSSNPSETVDIICPSSPNPTPDELETFQIALAQKELTKLDERETNGSSLGNLSPEIRARRTDLRLRLQTERIKRKPVPQRLNEPPDEFPERVVIFEDMRWMACLLCFSNAFIDKIPRLHPWYSIKKSARQVRDFLDGARRRFHGQVDFDMRVFHEEVKRDRHVPNKANEGNNVALRWNLVRLIWEIVCRDILLEMGEIDQDDLAWQTTEHIMCSIDPFIDKRSNQERLCDYLFYITSLATTLRVMLSSDSEAEYEFKLPPNSKGTCVGNGTPEHAEMIDLHGQECYEPGKPSCTVFGALVRKARKPTGALRPLVVECPAWVTEISLENC